MTEELPSVQAPSDGGWDRYDPSNASAVVAWLASDETGWLTDAVLPVDGSTVPRVLPLQVDQPVSSMAAGRTRLTPEGLGRAERRAFGAFLAGMPAGGSTG
jgi:hypothetical protein